MVPLITNIKVCCKGSHDKSASSSRNRKRYPGRFFVGILLRVMQTFCFRILQKYVTSMGVTFEITYHIMVAYGIYACMVTTRMPFGKPKAWSFAPDQLPARQFNRNNEIINISPPREKLLKRLCVWQWSWLVGGFNPFQKYYIVKLDHFPKVRGEHKKCLEPPPGWLWLYKDVVAFGATGQQQMLFSAHGQWVSACWLVAQLANPKLICKGILLRRFPE